MARICSFCGLSLADEDEVCPNCGMPVSDGDAQASEPSRDRGGEPRSLDELKAYCREQRLLPEKLRFSIGQDSEEPRTTGIFRDQDGMFVVYRNKSDGTRLERYRGEDEAEAVRVFFPRLQDELARQRSSSGDFARGDLVRRRTDCLTRPLMLIILLVVIIALVFTFLANRPAKGYYRLNDTYYYYESGDWYYYSPYVYEWIPLAAIDPELKDNFRDCFESSTYLDSFPVPDFYDLSPGSLAEAEGTEATDQIPGAYAG